MTDLLFIATGLLSSIMTMTKKITKKKVFLVDTKVHQVDTKGRMVSLIQPGLQKS